MRRAGRIVHTLKLYFRLLGVLIRSQMQYRASFTFLLVGTGLTSAMEFLSLALVMQRFDSIGGWDLIQVAFLYGLVEIAFGTMDMAFAGFDPHIFGRRVRMGDFDQILVRPINVTVQVLASEFTLRRVGKILVGIAIFGIAVSLLDIAWTPAKLLYLPVVLGSIFLFFAGLYVIGATITFWTVESIEVMNILTYGGAYLISHPMHIYQNWILTFFTFIVPAIFLNYYPALYFLDIETSLPNPAWAPFLSPVVGIGIFLLSLLVWRWGVRQYQSTGT